MMMIGGIRGMQIKIRNMNIRKLYYYKIMGILLTIN